jgi:tetratricopeptide (TPR) repeat protein
MNAYVSWVLAAAVGGAVSGSGPAPYPEARSVFVPELAAVDGTACRAPAATGAMPLLRVAQTATDAPRKRGISPAAKAAAEAAALPQADDDPPLMSGIGTRTLEISTSSAPARSYFDQGYHLGWAFNHDEAIRAFRKAQRLDPECAMCFWGEAWALGPNINVPMEDKAKAPAVAAVRNAQRLASVTSPREQALIAAMAARYSAESRAGRHELDRAYADAMREVAARFPDDLEIATLYADALMNVSPWDYWLAGGTKLRPAIADLIPTLENVLRKDPEHAAAIHLFIHSVEASHNPQRAEVYADRLAQLAPNAGHLVHMPSHIYFVIGRYKDSLATNLAAVKADEAYIALRRPQGVYPLGYYPHNVHFVMVSAQMGGDGARVLEAARKLGGLIPAEAARTVLLLQPIKAAPYFAHAQFSAADAVMAMEEPGRDLPYVETAWRYARGVALVRSGDVQSARAELAAIERIIDSTDYEPFATWKIPAKDVALIAAHVLRARIAQARDEPDDAIRELQAAVKLQDGLPYMEPAYWYYPIRQTLGAAFLMNGDTRAARDAFGASLARRPNNAWALYGLAQAYKREGRLLESQAVEDRFRRAWMGKRKKIDIAAL